MLLIYRDRGLRVACPRLYSVAPLGLEARGNQGLQGLQRHQGRAKKRLFYPCKSTAFQPPIPLLLKALELRLNRPRNRASIDDQLNLD